MADPNTIGHFFENFTTHMASVIIALIGFWTGFVRNLVNRKEVEEMLAAQSQASQYAKDRQFIMERLNSHKEDTSILFRALEKNTEVMTELKVQIATLGKTLEALEHRIEKP
jgi:peptidoglycan hydrolase CwlO-like protein|tara:strand:- start:3353 stop:3688 length:336 start_codon:yes stop_codon:yes gene_type:complete